MDNKERTINRITEYWNDKDGQSLEIQGLDLGLCYICLFDYPRAKKWFSISLKNMFYGRPFWKGGSEPNLFVDVWMMSNQNELAERIRVELENYKIENKDKNPIISYAISIIELNQMKNSDLSFYINRLKSLVKYPDIFAIGAAIEALSRADNEAFHHSMNLLLEAHKGMARRGSLRGTAEGLICLPAMSLGLLALKREMPMNIESEYFSMGYLQFLMQQ